MTDAPDPSAPNPAEPTHPGRRGAPQGFAALQVPAALILELAARLDPTRAPLDAVEAALLDVQLADVGVTDASQVLVTDAELVTPWSAFTRWALEPHDGEYLLVLARPGQHSSLAWSPELGEWGPDTDARAELDAALATLDPRLAALPLVIT